MRRRTVRYRGSLRVVARRGGLIVRDQERQARILRYWRAVEYFSPPRVDGVDFAKGIRNVDPVRALPWGPDAPRPHTRLRPKSVWQHTVYLGVFDLSRVREVLDATLRVTEEQADLDVRTDGQSALVSLTVNADGLLIRDSVTVSSCAWAVGRTVSPGPASDEWLLGFDDDRNEICAMAFGIGDGRVPLAAVEAGSSPAIGRIAGTAVRIAVDVATGGLASVAAGALAPLVEPAIARVSEQVADRVRERVADTAAAETEAPQSVPPTLGAKALTKDDLGALTRWVAEQLGVAEVLAPDIVRIKSYQVLERCADDAGSDEFLNSFYADDLERVAADIERAGAGTALHRYLVDDRDIDHLERIDVRRKPADVLRGLSPRSMPPARWPTKVEQTLSLSQQFAVNEIYRGLADPGARGIFAVNGPPGTGKTTLLRDLIAAVVVARAERLAELERPRDAFERLPRTWRTGETGPHGGRRLYPLISDLCGYEIVVASSNNGAVENITMEVPAADSVDADTFPQADYLGDQASLLIGKPAWGAIAARLGKRSFRGEFVERFWWGEGADTESGEAGLAELLKQFDECAAAGEQLEGILSWTEAVEEFDKAKDRVRRLTAARQYIADILEREFDVDPELSRLRTMATDRDIRLTQLCEYRSTAEDALRDALHGQQAAAAHLTAARRELAEAEAAVEHAAEGVFAAETALRGHDAQRPGFVRRLLWWNSNAEWEAEREPLMAQLAAADRISAERVADCGVHRAAVRTRQCALDEATLKTHAAQARVDRAARAVEDARAASSQAGAAIRHRESVLRRDAEALAMARDIWPSTVPRPEWVGQAEDRAVMEARELSSPWMDAEFAAARTDLFLAALKLHFAVLTSEPKFVRQMLFGVMDVVRGRAPADLPRETALAAWQLLFLVVPVISTTFASVARMFDALGREALGWLFIDEAGQAVPQAAVGALWRAQRAVVVGDPRQLEPVNTLPWSGQRRLCAPFGVDIQWTPQGSSVQSIADRLNRFGTWLPTPEGQDALWVGAPLRVHRRCDRLMFEVSNRIAYDNLMVFGTGEPHRSDLLTRNIWLDVPAMPSGEKWNPADGRYVVATLDLVRGRMRVRMADELDEIAAEGGQPPEWAADEAGRVAELNRRVAEAVFVVSPFTAVVDGLRTTLRGRLPSSPKRLGTVHTTQGKEAEIVLLVLGTATDRNGSRVWASATPNLLNVAITRAKRRLVIVGDHENWSRQRNFSVLARYARGAGERLLTRVDANEWAVGAAADWSRYDG